MSIKPGGGNGDGGDGHGNDGDGDDGDGGGGSDFKKRMTKEYTVWATCNIL